MAAVSGEAVFQRRCASCHDSAAERIPPRAALQQLTSARILRVLDFGTMMSMAYPLSREEREAVAAFLGKPGDPPPIPEKAYCSNRTVKLGRSLQPAWNGWSPDTTNRRFQPAGLSVDQVRNLELKWAYGFADDVSALGAPSVADGHVFVGSASGVVQALRASTGCVEWFYQAAGPVRSAPSVVPLGQQYALLFTDMIGSAYALDAESGKLLWKKKVDGHDSARLSGAIAVHDGVAFVPVASGEETRASNPEYACCTFRGSVVALRVKDGSQVWKTYAIREKPAPLPRKPGTIGTWGPSGAGIWSAPTIDVKRGLLYVTTGDNYSSPETDMSDAILAIEMKSGRIVWVRQTTPSDIFSGACTGSGCPGPDFDFGSSVLLEKLENGRDILLVGQKSGVVYALDPDKKGAILWQTRVGKGGTNGGIQWGMASDGQRVYAAVSDLVRQRRAGEALLPSSQVDPSQGGGLSALRISSGARAWFAAPAPCPASKPGCSPTQPAAVTAIPGLVFSGSNDGHIRAFSSEDGRVVWDFDTARAFQTVNGVPAKGGSMDGAGPVVAGGMVFVNSGYARNGGMPGNVLLAFGPK